MSVRSRSNWNLDVLDFEERGELEYQEKNLSEQGREPTTNSTHTRRGHGDLNPGHIAGWRLLSTLRHSRSPKTVDLLRVYSCIYGTHGLVCIMLCVGNRFGNESQHATLMSPLTFIDSPTLGAWSAGCWASLNTC